MNYQKYLALVDCDSFFVSCEQKRDTSLLHKPVSVVSGERGCILSRSKEAKLLGVKMGMPLFMAKEQYPQGIYINADHYFYSKTSKEVMSILKDMSPYVQIYSIDEAFVDLTGLKKIYNKNYYEIAKFIKQKVFEETMIPVSVGVSLSKTLSKLASDSAKSTDEHVIILGKSKIKQFLSNTDIGEVWGIGRRLSDKIKCYGINNAYEFTQKSDEWILKHFNKNLLFTKHELLGELLSPVKNEVVLPKSISDTKSFDEFTSDLTYLKNELQIHIHDTCSRLRKINAKCSSFTLIIKTKDFQTISVNTKLENPTNFEFDISKLAFIELEKLYLPYVLYRSIGISLENFKSNFNEQLSIFEDAKTKISHEKLGYVLDKLEKKYGRNIVKTGFTTKNIPFKQGFITSPRETD